MYTLDRFMRSQLKLRHLQLLIAIDDLRHVGKVADYLHVSQPAISKALCELENNIQLKLFHRTGHGMQPTAYGKSLIRYARRILVEVGKARDELSALVSGLDGKVSVGVLPGAAVAVLPEAIALLKQQSMNTGIIIMEGAMDVLKPKLLSGEIEIIVGMLPEDNPPSYIEKVTLYQDEMVLTAGRHHPLTKIDNINWQELRDTTWILPPHGSLTREPIEQIFYRHKLKMPVNYIESVSTMINIGVMQYSQALAFLPKATALYYSSMGSLVILPLKIDQLVQPVGVLHMKQQALSSGAESLINILKNQYSRCDKNDINKRV